MSAGVAVVVAVPSDVVSVPSDVVAVPSDVVATVGDVEVNVSEADISFHKVTVDCGGPAKIPSRVLQTTQGDVLVKTTARSVIDVSTFRCSHVSILPNVVTSILQYSPS